MFRCQAQDDYKFRPNMPKRFLKPRQGIVWLLTQIGAGVYQPLIPYTELNHLDFFGKERIGNNQHLVPKGLHDSM